MTWSKCKLCEMLNNAFGCTVDWESGICNFCEENIKAAERFRADMKAQRALDEAELLIELEYTLEEVFA